MRSPAANRCWQPGCPREAIPCYYGPPESEYTGPDAYYCRDHAREQGFCPRCGDYWAGSTLIDFDRIGLCLHCAQALETDRPLSQAMDPDAASA